MFFFKLLSDQECVAVPVTVTTAAVPQVLQSPAAHGPSPDKMTFSAKKRFFEKEIEQTSHPAAKPGWFSYFYTF